MEHSGKHALVTGGGTGIGAGIAMALADAGAEVTITGRRMAKLADVAAHSDRISAMEMDVSDEASVRDGIAKAAADRGPIQICVANAGIAEGGPFEKTTLAQWRKTMATNLDGVFLTFQAALATLEDATPARMIVVSSIAGVRGLKNAIPYTVTKHGVIGLIRGLFRRIHAPSHHFQRPLPRVCGHRHRAQSGAGTDETFRYGRTRRD